ncbi:hypothetical protein [Kitasatospora sp. NPDC087315]|uniref:hypothetical protein n=1 Tax=Kitasatospora sp. NPDC087315 TaxID=3364069 RepID=UPI003821ED43
MFPTPDYFRRNPFACLYYLGASTYPRLRPDLTGDRPPTSIPVPCAGQAEYHLYAAHADGSSTVLTRVYGQSEREEEYGPGTVPGWSRVGTFLTGLARVLVDAGSRQG